jgi:hypothetical protein
MRNLALVVLCLLAPSLAQGSESIPEQSNKLWETTKAVVEVLDPAIEYGVFVNSFDVGRAEGFTGISGSLYTYAKDGLDLASLRLGVALQSDHTIFATLQANGINLMRRYASDSFKEALSPGPMGDVWGFLADYGKLGIGPAFDAEDQAFGVVATIGGRINF